MQPTKLTARLLEKLKPGDRVTDTETKGLAVEVGRTGKIKLKYSAMLPDRSLFKKTLGEFPELSLDAARLEAEKLRVTVRKREDPREGTPRARGMWTVEQLFEEYLKDSKKAGKAPRTLSDIQALYDDYLKPAWGSLPLTAITAQLARKRHDDITMGGKNGQTSEDDPDEPKGPVVANGALRKFQGAWNWAIETQPQLKLGDNPVWAVTFNQERDRTDSLQLPDLRAWEAKVTKIKNPIRRDMHRFQLFSGVRPGTNVKLLRQWIHFDLKAIIIPANAVPQKGRKKKGWKPREFHLPLSTHMIELLKRIMAAGDMLFPGSPYLYPTRGNKTRVGEVIATQVWKEKGMATWTGHILRHVYSNACKKAGATGGRYDDVDRMLLLGHRVPGIEGAYLNVPYLFESLLAKQEQVTKYILSQLNPPLVVVEKVPTEPKKKSRPSKTA